jgi:FHA domain
MKERRKRERRNWANKPKYPLTDSNGVLVKRNRRRILDRRMNSKPDRSDNEPLSTRLHVSWLDITKELSATEPELLVGRALGCGICVDSQFASREHALFTYRDGTFCICDHSTNGTFLRLNQHQQHQDIHLVGKELPLSGSGLISLGIPIDQNDKNVIRFRLE